MLSSQSCYRQQGFTLIELLIAVAVAGVIAVLAYQAIESAVTISEHQTRQADELAELQRAVWWLEQDLMQMTARPILDELGSPLPAFMLQPERVEFSRIAMYPTPEASGGLVRVAYVLEQQQFVRLAWSVMDRAPDSLPQRRVLLQDVADFELRLLDANKQWQTHWPIDKASETPLTLLPGLVEVTLALKNSTQIRRLLPGVEGVGNE